MTIETETPQASTAKAERWTQQWLELYEEVINSGICTGCAACVISCPHDVIGYNHTQGGYKPFHLEEELGADDCIHGQKGCTSCTRACPRFRNWETEADTHLFGRTRKPEEHSGIYKDVILTKASDDFIYETGQDGGLVSAILIWCLENEIIDGALVSHLEGGEEGWKAIPAVATNKEEVLAGAGSRYTYSANTLAYPKAMEMGLKDLALVGMGCQTSAPAVMWNRKIGKTGKAFKLNIGLLCSKSFDDAIFDELFEVKYGLKRENIQKMNIKGVFQVWMKNGDYHEINLKECHAWTRDGCNTCPDFAAEHADISTGGIGDKSDWTLTVIRTELGREIIMSMLRDGVIEGRPGDADPGAIALMHKLAEKSRKRWPGFASSETAGLLISPAKPGSES